MPATYYFILRAILQLPKIICLEYTTFNRWSRGKERRVWEKKRTEERNERINGRERLGSIEQFVMWWRSGICIWDFFFFTFHIYYRNYFS